MLVTIMVDASWHPQMKMAGFGLWVACDRMKFADGGPLKTEQKSAIVAEIKAIINALHIACKRGAVLAGDTVLIQTDCLGAIDWLEKKVCPHEPSVIPIWEKMCRHINVRFRHVKGHTQQQENRFLANGHCDKHAKAGLSAAIEQNWSAIKAKTKKKRKAKTKPANIAKTK